MRNSYDEADVRRAVEQLASRVGNAFKKGEPLNIVGIRTRGETLAERLRTMLRERGFAQIGRGVLDITLYRDDLSEIGPLSLIHI